MKVNKHLDLIPFYGYTAKNNLKRNSFINEDSYTLYYEKNRKEVYKAGTKGMSNGSFMLLFLVTYPMMNYFPNEIIPYDNEVIFIILCLVVMGSSVLYGNNLTIKSIRDLRKVKLSAEEWEEYLQKGNKMYIRQIIFSVCVTLFLLACFILLYIYQAKWWLFGGIGVGVITGSSLTVFSKTRYALYKNKLDVHVYVKSEIGKYGHSNKY